ncbi:MAG TPA: lysophospholipase [Ilumatobacter sp.]|nr:lysophospholipase [Ilumatobacter sp.]
MPDDTSGLTPTHGEANFGTTDGLTLYRQWWLPANDATAVVMVFHGLGEHSGRYAHVAAALNAAGYAVHAVDHRGHGKSGGKPTYVKSYGEFMSDLVLFRDLVETAHPGLPLFLLGHSMGGNLAMGHTLDHQDGLAGLALSGPALKLGDDIKAIQVKIIGVLGKLAPGFRPQGLDASSISRDPAVVQAYRDDPLVYTGKMSAGIGWALIEQMEKFPARYVELRLPISVQHGTSDTLTNIEGSCELERLAVNAPVTSRYYDGLYHEIYNEPEQADVIGDLVAWLDSVVGAIPG